VATNAVNNGWIVLMRRSFNRMGSDPRHFGTQARGPLGNAVKRQQSTSFVLRALCLITRLRPGNAQEAVRLAERVSRKALAADKNTAKHRRLAPCRSQEPTYPDRLPASKRVSS